MPLFNDPAVSVIAVLVVTRALPSVHSPPDPLNVIGPPIETPLVVMVLPLVVALKVILHCEDQIVPAIRVMLPDIVRLGGPISPAKVTVPADTVRSRHDKEPYINT